MRLILLAFFIISSSFSQAQEIDVLHYKFALELNDKDDSINGLAAVTFVKKVSDQKLSLDLVSVNKQGKGMYVYLVTSDAASAVKLSFSQTADKIIISAPQIKKDDTATIYVAYKGIPADGLIISKNKYGDRTFFADNWPNRAHNWIPCNDRPDDKAMFEFRVTAPAHYSVISNGIKNGEKILPDGTKRTVWTENTPLPTKVMAIGVARFATKTFADSPSDIPVSAWVYPQDSTKGFYDYALAPDILKFFSNYIAPYPYKKLANVQSKTIFGGMENASAIFYAENSVTGDRSSEDLLAHEIAHQWFGDMASEKSFAHLWLSEGFATYLTNFYFEKKYGKEAAAERWKEEREQVIAFSKQSSSPVVDSTKNLMSLLNANSYQKGAWVLRMLRNEVGDTTFQKIIQTYYHQYKGSNADSKDFEAVAEKVSGKELTWFFDQWLYQNEIPRLAITYSKTSEGIRMHIKQRQKHPFQFILPVSVESNGKLKKILLRITKETESFLIGQDRDKRIIDLDYNLLFEEIK
ncbi:MAG TPA: M1 family metallopeptidase [Flavisolibacter sp.]